MKRAKCPNCKTYGIGEDDATALRNAKHQSSCSFGSKTAEVKESKPKKSKKSTESETSD